jgi:uncharacterized membrane protein YozB (DUF420 family)
MNAPFAAFSFPELNATLNAVCLVLLVAGYAAIRSGREPLHITCMVSALVVSTVFLASYLYYHYTFGHVVFEHRYLERHGTSPASGLSAAYGIILLTHIVLAVTVVPLALVTASFGLFAFRGSGRARIWHKRIACWTLPIWLYVSVTGVVVYGMVYQL